MSKQLTTLPASDADLHAARLSALHGAVHVRGMEFKLLTYFAGLEVVALRDLYKAEHGETRGAKKAGEEGKVSRETFTEFLKRATTVSKATAYRYTAHYEATAAAHPEAAAKLNAYYQKQVVGMALKGGAADGGAALALASPEGGKLPSKALEELAASPDVWGLHELFAEEGEEAEGSDEAADGEKSRKVSPLVKFWARDLCSRLKADEFLRLPKPQLRRVKAEFEAAAQRAAEALK